jgi:hypothetical protein
VLGQGRNPLVGWYRTHSRRVLAHAMGCACALVLCAAPARAQLEIRVDDPAITLTPTPADYNQDFVDATGSNGIRLRVKAQLGGCQVFVRCSDAAPEIALNDLMVRTSAAPGLGGTAMSVFTPVTAVNQTLWSSALSLPGFSTQLVCDVRVRNLMNYNDSPMVGTTAYQNTLTFTIISP